MDEALEVMLRAIENARKTIRFEIYIYRASPIGEKFREALIAACARGLEVKVMVDALGSIALSEKFWDPFKEAGGQFRWFNPLTLKRLGFRNHRKSLVCDEEIGFVGGFNIAPEYEGDGVTRGWHDLGIQVPQPLAVELARSFDGLFALADFRHKRFAHLRKSALGKAIQTSQGDLLLNAPGRGARYMMGAILNDLRQAQEVNIISAYFLPPRQIRRALMAVSRRGGKVNLIMAGKSDVPLSQMASRRLYSGLMRGGVNIYEFQPQILHTKLFLMDNVAYVGSANLDKRSLFINYEVLVRLGEKRAISQAKDFFQSALQHCRKLELADWRASRTMWDKLKEQWAYFVLAKVDPYLSQLQWRLLLSARKPAEPKSG